MQEEAICRSYTKGVKPICPNSAPKSIITNPSAWWDNVIAGHGGFVQTKQSARNPPCPCDGNDWKICMPKFEPKIHHRKSIRLPGYDYTQAGAYFVTIVTQNRENIFGEVVDGEMRLNGFGEIAAQTWEWLENQYPYVELGAWVVMPNHSHAILIILIKV
jgi:hypothetical protein